MRALLFSLIALSIAACGGGGDSTAPDGNASVASVSLNVTSSQIGVGQTLQLSATPLTSTGTVTSGTATWESTAPSIASVSASGLVTGLTAGSTNIRATISGVTGTAAVTVSAAGGGFPLTAEVTMPGNNFAPFVTTIRLGGTVTFRFGSADHNVIFDATKVGRPADIQITRNANVPRTFNTRGVFGYDCTLHPGMTGQVDVR